MKYVLKEAIADIICSSLIVISTRERKLLSQVRVNKAIVGHCKPIKYNYNLFNQKKKKKKKKEEEKRKEEHVKNMIERGSEFREARAI
jgi:hypothetical protein